MILEKRMRKSYVVGNLKMNMLSREEAVQYLAVLKREMTGKHYAHVIGIVCPSYLYLPLFDHLPQGIRKGAQDLFPEKSGAYTGEISPIMLKNDGVEYVIVGHSERRQYAHETDVMICEKTMAAIKHHLTPIVCVGETKEERQKEETDQILSSQVKTILSGFSKSQAEQVIIAYEPRWAIGTDAVPSTQEILQVRILLRKLFVEMFDAQTAERITVIYGGSVKSSFLAAVSFDAQMDGVLVGRESLFPYELVKMMELCEEAVVRQRAA